MHFKGIYAASVVAFAALAAAKNGNSACAKIAYQQSKQQNSPDYPSVSFDADTAFECAKSVQLVKQDALQLIHYCKQYWQFQTTLSYLKNPPKDYQQPPVDVMGSLDNLAERVSNNEFQSQYDFDHAMFKLVGSTHEEHFNLNAGVIDLFIWTMPHELTSVSSDGSELPEVYAYDDIANGGGKSGWKPSPIVEMNGMKTVDFLEQFARNYTQAGTLENHAEFNVLTANLPLAFANGLTSFFSRGTTYRGSSIKGKFANDTSFEWKYAATTKYDFTQLGLMSGDDVYKKFVLAQTVAPAPPTQPSATAGATSTPEPPQVSKIPFNSYPVPDVRQEAFGMGGTVSGYILKDLSVGVLSMPSFSSNDPTSNPPSASAESFSEAVAEFIASAKKAGVKKVVVDLQGNGGGTVLQGYDTFRQFFPTTEPELYYRIRAHPAANLMGKVLTDINLNRDGKISAGQQKDVALTYGNLESFDAAYDINEEGKQFGSWEAYYGPQEANGDKFSNNARFNFSNYYQTSFPFGQYVYGYGDNPAQGSQPFKAEDIIMLTDGQCGSTCSIFAELMMNQGGVKSVAVGGVPKYGAMQAVAGTRGSSVLQWQTMSNFVDLIHNPDTEDGEIDLKGLVKQLGVSKEDLSAMPPSLSQLRMSLRQGRFNALDELRKGDNVPLTFKYQPADCRLFFTAENVRDVTSLWNEAAKVAGGDFSRCVKGSSKNSDGSSGSSQHRGSDKSLASSDASSTTCTDEATATASSTCTEEVTSAVPSTTCTEEVTSATPTSTCTEEPATTSTTDTCTDSVQSTVAPPPSTTAAAVTATPVTGSTGVVATADSNPTTFTSVGGGAVSTTPAASTAAASTSAAISSSAGVKVGVTKFGLAAMLVAVAALV